MLVEYFSGKPSLSFADVKSNHLTVNNIYHRYASWKQKQEMILLAQGII